MTRSVTARDFETTGFCVARVPLLPFDVLVALGSGLSAPLAADSDLSEALSADRAAILSRLQEIVRRPEVREALQHASTSLDDALGAWIAEPESHRGRRVTSTVVRYISRMSSRATPFGLFSSCGTGRVSDGSTRLTIGDRRIVIRHTRLDMQYLNGLVDVLERSSELRAELRYRPSSGLYRSGGQIHYAETSPATDGIGTGYRLVAVDSSAPLQTALEIASQNALPEEIAQALVARHPELSDDGAPNSESALVIARGFVSELIDSQVLVSELRPPTTGEEPIHHLERVLGATRSGSEAASRLRLVRDGLIAIDAMGLGLTRNHYEEIAAQLRELPGEVDSNRLFQVDLAGRADELCLGTNVIDEISRAVVLLHRISPVRRPNDLRDFCKAFRARYEDRSVPMVEALDDEIGIGFGTASAVPSEIIDGLPLPNPTAFDPYLPNKQDEWKLRRIVGATGHRAARWELDERDLTALTIDSIDAVPRMFSVSVSLGAESARAVEEGDFRLMVGVRLGAAEPLGRFCHADATLSRHVSDLLRKEEAHAPDVAFSEIVHLPGGRTGNILSRPVLRQFEIPYLGSSGAEPSQQIPIDDLWLVVEGDVVRLWSKRLGRWVEPHMTNAHNPRLTSLTIYRFLCALRYQETREAAWDWGLFAAMPHLPRVSSGKVILALEEWNIDSASLERLRGNDATERFRALQALRREHELPRWVTVAEQGDHMLVVDFDNVLSCETVFDLIKGRQTVKLIEVFPPVGEMAAFGPDGRYVAELLVPMLSTAAPIRLKPVPPISSGVRSFAPGSEWLYVKVYVGRATADDFLRDVVGSAEMNGLIDQWFFIRYADPDPHIRLRFHGAPEALLGRVLPEIHRLLSAWTLGHVHRVVVDTYEREVERYGGDRGIEIGEALFCADSRAVMRALKSFDRTDDREVRWRLALVGMNRLLDDLGLDLSSRRDLCNHLRQSFGTEFSADTTLERELGARYRKNRGEVEDLLDGVAPNGPPSLVAGLEALRERSTELAPIVSLLRSADESKQLTSGVEELAGSYLHMFANRILAADHRAQELVLYDFLLRYYESKVARARRSKVVS